MANIKYCEHGLNMMWHCGKCIDDAENKKHLEHGKCLYSKNRKNCGICYPNSVDKKKVTKFMEDHVTDGHEIEKSELRLDILKLRHLLRGLLVFDQVEDSSWKKKISIETQK
jgi:hypothetical protein